MNPCLSPITSLDHTRSSVSKHYRAALRQMVKELELPFKRGSTVGIKLHWGEVNNTSYLSPYYAKEIVQQIKSLGMIPFIFDTTVLYSGGRHTATASLKTAFSHGFTETFLGCPVIIGDGIESRNVISIFSGLKHFKTVQIVSLINNTDGFLIFSHFKGHEQTGFGGALKNLAMGFASRAQKQRIHSDAHPVLNRKKCSRCGTCIQHCATGAATTDDKGYPLYNLDVCNGCAQCIALCPEEALKIFWTTSNRVFQEKLIETAAALWQHIKNKTVFINALITITASCDCLSGHNPIIASDYGFIFGYHPVTIDALSLQCIGTEPFRKAHRKTTWQRQFEFAREIGFWENIETASYQVIRV